MGEAVSKSKAAPAEPDEGSAEPDEGFFGKTNLTNLFGQLETLVEVTSLEVTIPEVCRH